MPYRFNPQSYYSEEENDFRGFSPEEDYNEDEIDRLRKLNRRNPSEDIYNEYMQSAPNREDYKPSIWRKLGGTLLGALSRDPYGSAQQFVNQPYLEALRQHKEAAPIARSRAQAAEKQADREYQLEKFGIQEGAKKRRAESSQESSQLKASMDAEEKAMRESRISDNERIQQERQRIADERSMRAEGRSASAEKRAEEYHRKRMQPRIKTGGEFEYKESPSTALRESEAEEDLRQLAIDKTVNNEMFRDYFDIVEDKKGNKQVNLKKDIPEHLRRDVKRIINEEFEALKRKGRKKLPKRVVEEEFEE